MLRNELFDSNRGEVEIYQEAAPTTVIPLPLTRTGFETLLIKASETYKLPVDDASRSTLAGYVHHISNEEHTTTIERLANMLYKHFSNALTWVIDQEIKAKRYEEDRKAKEAAIKAASEAAQIGNPQPIIAVVPPVVDEVVSNGQSQK